MLRLLGAGGMGEVFLARDTTLERDVAIKVLPAALSADPMARERFRREALAAASLDHPFICKVFEIGDADGPSTPGTDGVAVRSGRGRLFIVMESSRARRCTRRSGAARGSPGLLDPAD